MPRHAGLADSARPDQSDQALAGGMQMVVYAGTLGGAPDQPSHRSEERANASIVILRPKL
jgi:hypothetical protein